ncbi:hypothetical protein P9H28_12715, partial [Paenibacillus barengoltzii]|uniref:hypothetical protein n=1 Tax=Paenibacillus barengoltzii TaxID=343517 RepID=UPI002DB5932A
MLCLSLPVRSACYYYTIAGGQTEIFCVTSAKFNFVRPLRQGEALWQQPQLPKQRQQLRADPRQGAQLCRAQQPGAQQGCNE